MGGANFCLRYGVSVFFGGLGRETGEKKGEESSEGEYWGDVPFLRRPKGCGVVVGAGFVVEEFVIGVGILAGDPLNIEERNGRGDVVFALEECTVFVVCPITRSCL